MPKYKYTAVDVKSKRITAVIDAKDIDDLRKIIRAEGLVPVKIKSLEDKKSNYKLKARETAEFSKQLSGMLGSGITAVRGIEIMKNRDYKPEVKRIYENLHRDLTKGSTLSEAMRLQGAAFPELLMNMYASGEASGQLEKVTSKMADHYEKEHRLNSKIKSAMTYPAVLLVATVGVVMILFTLILPTFFELFEGMELPALTRGIMALSGFLQNQWYWVIIGALVVVAGWQYLLKIPSVRLKYDLFKLRFGIVGKLLKIIYTARFSRTLSSLYSSGVSMLTALEITATIIGNSYIEGQFPEVIKEVRNGDILSEAVGRVDGFDRKLTDMIQTGEETGRLDYMLDSVAESFDYEAEMASIRLVQLIEPIMIVVMAGIIGFIMVAVIMPLMDPNAMEEAMRMQTS